MTPLPYTYWFLSTIFVLLPTFFYCFILTRRKYFYGRLLAILSTYTMLNILSLKIIPNYTNSYLSIYFYLLSFLSPIILLILTQISFKEIVYYSLLSTTFYYLMIQLACLFLALFYPNNFFENLLFSKIMFTVLLLAVQWKTINYFRTRDNFVAGRTLLNSICVVTLGVTFNSLLFSILNEYSILIYLFQLSSMICCLLFIIYQLEKVGRHKAMQENESAKEMIRNQKKQYLEKENYMELINFKYHQLKHLITIFDEPTLNYTIRDIDSMSLLETGNPAVDIALFEINSYCIKEGILFTSMVDAQSLESVDIIDLYVLLKSVFSSVWNVREESSNIDFSRKLDIKIHQQKQFIRIRLENSIIESDKLVDYDNYHLKNASKILEKYDGYLAYENTESGRCLKILIPLVSVI